MVLVQFPIAQITWQYKQYFKYLPGNLHIDPVTPSFTKETELAHYLHNFLGILDLSFSKNHSIPAEP